jgi:hypothetical protein
MVFQFNFGFICDLLIAFYVKIIGVIFSKIEFEKEFYN